MGILDLFKFGKTEKEIKSEFLKIESDDIASQSVHPSSYTNIPSGNYPVIEVDYDGEKTIGELGLLVKSIPNYDALRIRGYEADLKIGVVKIVTGAYYKWVVGKGLKLQCEPNKAVLEYEGININPERWAEIQRKIEAYFSLFATSKKTSYKEDLDLHGLALEAFKTCFAGGDSLVVCRFENKKLNVQVIDGQHIRGESADGYTKKDGHTIKNGIVFDERGRHFGYFIETLGINNEVKTEFIPAKGKLSNKRMAWLIYGDKSRIDSTRGIPEFTATLETANKLDRYIEASVKKAEEAANLVYTVEHDHTSTGEDPLATAKLEKSGAKFTDKEIHMQADHIVNSINRTTNGTAYNLPIGAKFKGFSTDAELNFPDFFKSILSYICSQVNMPPEVAMQAFNSNYSASRAAINSWGHTVGIKREQYAKDFYIPIYKLWLELMVLTDKIQIDEFKKAILTDNEYVIDSFSKCRFIGTNMPHIDPLKEVKAVRAMLGDETTPLITFDQASEVLNNGEFSENLIKFSEEKKQIDKLIPKQDETTTEVNE